MAFNDLLSTSFLFSVAIIIILIGGIFAYVSYRMSEQDHKITSMVGLISTMAEELQFFRSKLSARDALSPETTSTNHIISILNPNNLATEIIDPVSLISVSDDDAESESDDESESESDDESESDESNGDDDECELDESNGDDDECELDEIVDLEAPMSLIQSIDINQGSETDNIKSIHLAEPIDLIVSNHDHCIEHYANDLKTISITDLEDTNKKPEYKKMSLPKLKEVIVEKGIVADPSKLKKNDILKLLGDE